MRMNSSGRRLVALGGQAEIVDPELTTDRTASRQAPDMQHEQLAIVCGGEFAGGGLPEAGFFQFIAVIEDGLSVCILNCKVRAAGAFDFSILVVGRELVERAGLHGNELADAGVGDSWTVKGDKQGAMAAVKIAGIEGESHARLFLILPVEA